jgi:hypothetical protein
LLTVANRARIAGIPQEQAFTDIRENIPQGKRHVSDREIADAINLGYSSDEPAFIPKPKPIISNGAATLRKLIEPRLGVTDADIREASPDSIDGKNAAELILQTLYAEEDLLFIGERHDEGVRGGTILTTGEWAGYYRRGGSTAPHVIPNPLSGKPAPKKSGNGMTYRGDFNVAEFRFCVGEFDNISRDDQLAFWSVIDLPIVALIDTGGKSIHALLDVRQLADVTTFDDWNRHIRDRLYAQILVPLGCDPACSNPSRLSRLPGHYREEKQNWQRLLYLSPVGRRIF